MINHGSVTYYTKQDLESNKELSEMHSLGALPNYYEDEAAIQAHIASLAGDGGNGGGDPGGGGDPNGGDPSGGGNGAGGEGQQSQSAQNIDVFAPIKEKYGIEVKSIGDLDPIFERANRLADVENKYNALIATPHAGYANENIAQFDRFVRETGIENHEVFNFIRATDFATADPIDLLVADFIMNDPSLAPNKDALKERLVGKYNVDPEVVKDPVELALNKAELKTMTKAIQEKMAGIKTKISTSNAPVIETEEQRQGRIAQLTASWRPQIDSVKTLGEFKIPLADGTAAYEFKLDDKHRGYLTQQMEAYAMQNNMELNDENFNKVKGTVANMFVLQHLGEIMSAYASDIRSMTDIEFLEKYNNTSKEKSNGGAAPKGVVQDPGERSYNEAMNSF